MVESNIRTSSHNLNAGSSTYKPNNMCYFKKKKKLLAGDLENNLAGTCTSGGARVRTGDGRPRLPFG